MKNTIKSVVFATCLLMTGLFFLAGCSPYSMVAIGLEAASGALKISSAVSKEKKAKAEAYYQQAEQFAQAGQYTMAEENYKKAIETNPNRLQYRSNLGTLYAREAKEKNDLNYYRLSNEQYLYCLEKDPKNSRLMNAIAWQCFLLQDDADKAIELIEKAIKLDGRNEFYIGTYGCLLGQKGDYQASIELLEEAIKKHLAAGTKKGAATDMYHLALAYAKIGNTREALAKLDQAQKIDPANEFREKIEKQIPR